MRVLHFYKTALPESTGGVEQVIDQIARGTTTLGVTNTVLALSRQPNRVPVSINGYSLITVSRDFEFSSTGISRESYSVFKALMTETDLIHYHFPWPFADLIHHLVKPGKPTLLTYHSDIIRQKLLLRLYWPLMQSFLGSVDHIVATSPNYLATSQVLKSFRARTSVIPIGLDAGVYPKPDMARVRYFKSFFGERFFLFIGAFRYYKGLQTLVEAARAANYPIVVAGSGPAEREITSLAAQYQLTNMFFLGQISDEEKSSLLEACFCLVSASNLRSEAFGVSLLEGAMFGRPMISCEIGTGTTYVNIHHLTGLVIPPSDPQALTDALTWLWSHPEQATEMGARARTRYEAVFTAREMAKSYYDLYRNLLRR